MARGYSSSDRKVTDLRPPPLPLLVSRRIAQAEADLTAYVRERTGRTDLTVAFVVSPIRPEPVDE